MERLAAPAIPPCSSTSTFNRPIHLIAGRVSSHLMDAGKNRHAACGVGAYRAVEQVHAHEYLPSACGGEGWMGLEAVSECGEQSRHHEAPAKAPGGHEDGADSPGQYAAYLWQSCGAIVVYWHQVECLQPAARER